MSKPVSLRLPDELLASLDGARGDTSRSEWIVRAIERHLEPPRTVVSAPPGGKTVEVVTKLTERCEEAEQRARDLEAQLHIERAQIAAPVNDAERISIALRGGPVSSLQAKAGVMPIVRTGKKK